METFKFDPRDFISPPFMLIFGSVHILSEFIRCLKKCLFKIIRLDVFIPRHFAFPKALIFNIVSAKKLN